MEREIDSLTKEEIINPSFIPSLFAEYTDEKERQDVLMGVLEMATKYRVLGKVKKEIDRYNKETKMVNNNIQALLVFNGNGQPEPSVENYLNVMRNDEKIKDKFSYNLMTGLVTKMEEGKVTTWTDMDDSWLRGYIEKNYGVYHLQKYYDAFNIVVKENSYHPIKDLIENKSWDGTHRIERFLIDILGAEDNDYSKEVSRLIFHGGINRLYNPGCKFDYMPILIGKQGSAKSTIVNWLALNDSYYRDVTSIEGKDSLEMLSGAWMCEMGELLAMVRNKDVEAMKGFITRCVDKYRPSYGRRTLEVPRTCIFIGTTNDYEFLTDKSGNRRYLPIEIYSDGKDLYKHEKNIKEYILECWREAFYDLKSNNITMNVNTNIQEIANQIQQKATADDPKVGTIIDYLSNKEIGYKVCSLELFTNCFNGLKKNFSKQDAKEISRIMATQTSWKRRVSTARFESYGVQRYWEKISIEDIVDDIKKVQIFDDKWSDLE